MYVHVSLPVGVIKMPAYNLCYVENLGFFHQWICNFHGGRSTRSSEKCSFPSLIS